MGVCVTCYIIHISTADFYAFRENLKVEKCTCSAKIHQISKV